MIRRQQEPVRKVCPSAVGRLCFKVDEASGKHPRGERSEWAAIRVWYYAFLHDYFISPYSILGSATSARAGLEARSLKGLSQP
ncbi:MAG: hypothetical protein QXM43_00300 [Desulfurococcaceae archaeon]